MISLRRLPYEAVNYLSFLLLAFLLISLQTSLWMQVLGYFPPPYMWAPILCYWSISRGWVRGAVMAYLLGLVMHTFSGMALEMIFASVFALFIIMFLLRDRLLWRGHVYFSFACFVATLLHPILIFTLSHVLEAQPVRQFHFFDWILSSLLTALVAFPLYSLMLLTDKLSFGESSEDSEAKFT